MSESQVKLSPAGNPVVVVNDNLVLELRTLKPSEELDLLLGLGAQDAMNFRATQLIMRVARVMSINNVPRPPITSVAAAKSRMDEIGRAGMQALTDFEMDENVGVQEQIDSAKNSASTP